MIRVARMQDAAQILEIYKPFVLETAITFEVELPTMAQMQTRITDTLMQYPWLVFEQNGQILGYTYAMPFRSRTAYQWTSETSVYLLSTAKGKGIGQQLYNCLGALLKHQNYVHQYAVITLPNEASVGFHKSLSFEFLALYPNAGYKLWAWHDVLFMSKTIGSLEEPPKEILPFRDAVISEMELIIDKYNT